MAGRRLFAILAIVALLSCCTAADRSAGETPSTVAATTQPSTAPVPVLAGVPMEPCTIGSFVERCGTLQVPEDPTNPEGRQIDLRVVVLPATGSTPRPDPVFFLAGGPGGAATTDLTWVADAFAVLHRDHDFVLVDQRGTGSSNQLVAPEPPDTTGQTRPQVEATLRAWVHDVLASLPGDPRFYTTSVAMDDIDQVRAALGADRIDLFGASYGATAVQYFLRQHPDRVRAAVLDGGSLLDVPIFERIAPNSQAALDAALDRCAADEACNTAFPDIRGDLARALATVRDEPITTSVLDPAGTPIVLDEMAFTGTIHAALLTDAATARLPWLIHRAANGDWDPVAMSISGSPGAQGVSNDRLVMATEIRCSEAWARFDPAETARLGKGSYLADAEVTMATNQALSCGLVPGGVVPADDDQPVRSSIPVLLTVGSADPQDPPANIANAARDLPASRTVIVPGEGHTVAHLGCLPSLIADFLDAGSGVGLDTSCAATSVSLPAFMTP